MIRRATARRWRPALALFVAALAVTRLYGCGSHYTAYDKWWEVGPVQILEGPDEVWVFAEANREVLRPGPLVEPPVIVLGGKQCAVVFSSKGPERRYDCGEVRLSFNVNISRIFRCGRHFYAIQDASMNQPRCLWIWGQSGFVKLPKQESDEIMSTLGLANVAAAEVDRLVDKVNEDAGWRTIYAENWPLAANLAKAASERHAVAFALHENGPLKSLVARSSVARGWVETIIEVDRTRARISEAEYEALWQRSK